jgi:uncharacterized membrane protein
MSDRASKTALIVSLLVNAFLAAALAAGAIYLSNGMAERANLHQHTPLAMLARNLDPSVRDQLHNSMRQVALSASADFNEAHAARKDAADHLVAPTVDRAAIEADLAKARAAEDRGRAKVEAGFVAFVTSQPQPVRAKLAAVLLGRNSMRLNGHGGPPPPHDGALPPPPADGFPPPPSSGR